MRAVVNPLGPQFDMVRDQMGAFTFKFKGYTEELPLQDPGEGYLALDWSEEFTAALVISVLDVNSAQIGWFITFAGLAASDLTFWITLWPKNDPKRWISFYMHDATTIDDEEETVLAYSYECFPWIYPLFYDEDEDDWIPPEWDEGEELCLTIDISWNPDYVGSLGEQSYDNVTITGGSISGVTSTPTTLKIPLKADTGDPTGQEGMIYGNTYDDKVKIYIDGEWRTLLDYA